MTPELAKALVQDLIERHPVPWRIEIDWTAEIYDGRGVIVIKLPMTLGWNAMANELIELATQVAEEDAAAEADAKEFLRQQGIDD